jgi:hypothetical protein
MRAVPATILALSIAGFLAACGGGTTESKPATPASADAGKKEQHQPHEHGGLPGLADALKGEDKKEEAKPAEPAKPADAAKPAETAKPAEAAKPAEPAKK